MAAASCWRSGPAPAGLIDLIAAADQGRTCRQDAKLIAIGVFSPFFVPLKVLLMAAVLLALPVAACTRSGCSSRPASTAHEKKFALPLIFFGTPAGLLPASRLC